MKRVARFLVISVLIMIGLALGLVASQQPEGTTMENTEMDNIGGLDFTGVANNKTEMPAMQGVKMRDGFELQVREYPNPNKPLVIMIHGSGWNGLHFNGLADGLKDDFAVIVPDLRGHGANAGPRGDVGYIGQLEDDLADLISAKSLQGQKVILLGHSSGGGLVVRFAGGQHGGMVDAAVLLAPFLKYNAPTTRVNSGGWAKILTRRMIGLSMLNMVGVTGLNRLTVIEFDMPRSVLDGPLGHLATTAYSFRMNKSYAPRSDYLQDIKALPPFLLTVGEQDEAFFADQFEPVMSNVTDTGRYVIVSGVNHLGIVDNVTTTMEVSAFLDDI